MLRRLMRSTFLGTAFVALAALPSTGQAQTVFFQSCAIVGVCGYVDAVFVGSILTVRIQNQDNVLGSALYDAQLIFASALNPSTPGSAFTRAATAAPDGSTTSIGTTPSNAWSFSGLGGSNVLDLTTFFNVFIEGTAASPFRAAPGDPDNGTWVTNGGFVTFTADLAGIGGLSGNAITGLGFCTQVDCASGPALATPEPASLTLLATGLAGIAAARRRRKNRTAI